MRIGDNRGDWLSRCLPFFVISVGLWLLSTLVPEGVIAASVQGASALGPIMAEGSSIQTQRSATDRYVEGELLIKYKQGVSGDGRTAFTRRHSLEEMRRFPRVGVHHMKIPKGSDVADYIERIRHDEEVEYVEPNYKRRPMGTLPNDPAWSRQWGAQRIGLPSSWDYIQNSQRIIVAVVDTGVDYNHVDLSANMWKNSREVVGNLFDDDNNGLVDDVRGWNFYSHNNDPMDTYSHGTHVAGIIGAIGNNGLGVAGVNWRTSIMAVKFMDADGGDVAGEIDAIEYAVDMGAKIINASFGDTTFSQAEYDAIQSAGAKGVLFVAAAGNSGTSNDGLTKNYPSSYNLPNIIAVAASDSSSPESLAYFSNYGATSVHVAAPGVSILSTIPESQSSVSGALLSVPSAPDVVYYPTGMDYAGQLPSGGITKTLYDCGYGYAYEFPPAVAGNIALIKRGSPDASPFYFSEKVTNAQNAGAVAAIIYNNVSGTFSGTLGAPGQWIPAVSISLEEGEDLQELGNPVVTLAGYPYGLKDGTSMATPFVAGVAALLWAERPDATASQIKQAILESVDAVTSLNGKVATGGRLNAYKALQRIASIVDNEMRLRPGWNFVSFPRLPFSNVSVGTVLSDVSAGVRVVWTYDNQNKAWLTWRPSGPTTFTYVTQDRGYWIYYANSQNEEGIIDAANWLADFQNITLYDGWNLIGYGGGSGKKVTSALDPISDNWNMIWSWDNGSWYGKSQAISILPAPIQPLVDMNMGRAYWIKVQRANSQIQWEQ